MRAIVIADDLTGALDCAVSFAQRGLRTICAFDPGQFDAALASGADVVALSTASREIPQDEARARVAALKSRLPLDALWIKKIDSRLKGHIRAETLALRRGDEPISLCPAMPRLGRIVRNGLLQGAGVARPLPVAETCGLPAQVIEADSQEALDAAIAGLDTARLFVGAAGMTTALARRLAPDAGGAPVPVLQGPALMAIGSRDPVTLAQLARVDVQSAPNGTVGAPLPPTAAPVEIIQMVAGGRVVSGHVASKAFARTIAARVAQSAPETLLVCGGETGDAILRTLGCGCLELVGEALPGVPVSRALNGPKGLTIITKSGGLGAPDTLEILSGRLRDQVPSRKAKGVWHPGLN